MTGTRSSFGEMRGAGIAQEHGLRATTGKPSDSAPARENHGGQGQGLISKKKISPYAERNGTGPQPAQGTFVRKI